LGNVAEAHKITCPYCIVGWSIVQIKRDGNTISYEQDGHLKCVTCHRYFMLKRQLRLYGAQLEESAHMGANGGR